MVMRPTCGGTCRALGPTRSTENGKRKSASNVAAQTALGRKTFSQRVHLWQQPPILLSGGLGGSDAVDDEPNTALGDDVRDAVSHLDVHYRLGPMEAEHGEDVHDGV